MGVGVGVGGAMPSLKGHVPIIPSLPIVTALALAYPDTACAHVPAAASPAAWSRPWQGQDRLGRGDGLPVAGPGRGDGLPVARPGRGDDLPVASTQ